MSVARMSATRERCIREGLVGGEAFAIDASLISSDASRQKGIEGKNGLPSKSHRSSRRSRPADNAGELILQSLTLRFNSATHIEAPILVDTGMP